MKRIFLLTTLILLSTLARSQNCEAVLTDEAGVIHDPSAIAKAVQPLLNEGADPKVVTISSIQTYGGQLANAEAYYESKCPSWRIGKRRKANLFVIMVAPNDRKKNVFVGDSYTPALGSSDNIDKIYSRAASPLFGQKLWAEGVAAAAKDFGARIIAYHDRQQHPAVTSYDFSFLKTFFWLFFGTLAAFFIGWFIYALFQKRKEDREAVINAQTSALDEWNRTNQAYLGLRQDNANYDSISRQFSDLSNSVKYNPNETMSKAEYIAAGSAWRDLRRKIESATAPKTEPATPPSGWNTTGSQTIPRAQGKVKHESRHAHNAHNAPAPAPTPTAKPAPTTTVRETTVIHDRGGDDFLTGVVVGDMLGSRRDPEPYREPERYREPDPEPEPERSSWGSSGSDSSWGSSDSSSDSSSSDFGSGSDSSFGGGDSGGSSGSDSSF